MENVTSEDKRKIIIKNCLTYGSFDTARRISDSPDQVKILLEYLLEEDFAERPPSSPAPSSRAKPPQSSKRGSQRSLRTTPETRWSRSTTSSLLVKPSQNQNGK